MSGEEVVQLLLHSALALGVFGQQVAGEAQRVAARLVPGHQEDERLAHDLVLADAPLLLSRRLLLAAALVLVLLTRRRFLRLLAFSSRERCVKVFQGHVVSACSGVQHQLEEVATPLHAKKNTAVLIGRIKYQHPVPVPVPISGLKT